MTGVKFLLFSLLILMSGTSLIDTYAIAKIATPIDHLIIIYQENVSFDHYFGTYPNAVNPPGEPSFSQLPNTPSVNGLSGTLLTYNPNLVNPFRIPRSQTSTCDNDHEYSRLQEAYNGGIMDKFVQSNKQISKGCDPIITMGYFDGNTVTALWNYAQHYAMSDSFFGSIFGPSTPGHINLVSGQTHGVEPTNVEKLSHGSVINVIVNGTMISDPNPLYDDCFNPATKSYPLVSLAGTNVGDLLNRANVTWGWFQGGFKPTNWTANRTPICGSTHGSYENASLFDYLPHHEPFQFYKTTANPHHLAPTSVHMIGSNDQANHQYDLIDFWDAAELGNLPAVSFLKAAAFQDGHAGYSNPLDEQTFLVETINRLQNLPEWNHTAVIIAYDDSDGWYDHVMPPIVSQSDDPENDRLLGLGLCGKPAPDRYDDRCGYGPRLPFLVISPFAKINYVDHQIIDQASILRFIEDNWNLGQIGDQSFDSIAGPILNLFDFTSGHYAEKVLVDPFNGTVLW